jgi:hypothetical protein
MRYRKIREGDFMTTANTYHSLNDYRVSTTSVYENGSRSKLGAAAIVIAIFLGVGGYFYYSTPQPSAVVKPASGDMNYQAPAAPDSTAPADTIDHASLSYAPNAAATAPSTPAADVNAVRAPAPESALDRTATQSKPNVAPAQPAQRIKQPAKPITKLTTPFTPASTDSTATATPDRSSRAPVIAPPAAADPATDTAANPMLTTPDATHPDIPADIPATAPTDAAPVVTTGDGTGG